MPTAGTLSALNHYLEDRPIVDFINYTLRGIGQVIFVNNPISGLLILLALFVQSFWVGCLGLIGVLASTITALILQLDRVISQQRYFWLQRPVSGGGASYFWRLGEQRF